MGCTSSTNQTPAAKPAESAKTTSVTATKPSSENAAPVQQTETPKEVKVETTTTPAEVNSDDTVKSKVQEVVVAEAPAASEAPEDRKPVEEVSKPAETNIEIPVQSTSDSSASSPKVKKVTFEEPSVAETQTSQEDAKNEATQEVEVPQTEESQTSTTNESTEVEVAKEETIVAETEVKDSSNENKDTPDAQILNTASTDSVPSEVESTVVTTEDPNTPPVAPNADDPTTVQPKLAPGVKEELLASPGNKPSRRATTTDIDNKHASPLDKLRNRSSVVGAVAVTTKPKVANVNKGSLQEKEQKKIHDSLATLETKIEKLKNEIDNLETTDTEDSDRIRRAKEEEYEIRETQKKLLESKEQTLTSSANANELELRKILKPFDEQMKAYDNACWQLHAIVQAVNEAEADFYRQSAEAYLNEANEIKNNNLEESKKQKALAEKHIQSALQARNEK